MLGWNCCSESSQTSLIVKGFSFILREFFLLEKRQSTCALAGDFFFFFFDKTHGNFSRADLLTTLLFNLTATLVQQRNTFKVCHNALLPDPFQNKQFLHQLMQ